MIEIKNRWTGETIFKSETAQTVRGAVIEAVANRARLDRASLDGARLDGASLVGASLVGASLEGASLVGARLDRASLEGARLVGARLDGARLDGASLEGARLDGASLDGARLDGASLEGARLDPIKADLWMILAYARNEVQGLLYALRNGRIDGSTYNGECACLCGTIANILHCDVDSLDFKNSERPAERWFLAIKKGDTPETNQVSKITEGWIEEWLALQPDLAAAK